MLNYMNSLFSPIKFKINFLNTIISIYNIYEIFRKLITTNFIPMIHTSFFRSRYIEYFDLFLSSRFPGRFSHSKTQCCLLRRSCVMLSTNDASDMNSVVLLLEFAAEIFHSLTHPVISPWISRFFYKKLGKFQERHRKSQRVEPPFMSEWPCSPRDYMGESSEFYQVPGPL